MRSLVGLLIVLGVAAAACSGTQGAANSAASRTSNGSRATSRPCLYRDVFAALDEVSGIQALCPTWLLGNVRPSTIFADDEPRYEVEFHPFNGLFPHIVLELSGDNPPGRRIRDATVRGKGGSIYFNPPNGPNQQQGLHSGHYIVVFPGAADQRGSYWVSVHEDTQRSRAWNIDRLLEIARDLQPVS